jgi:hypothetical protein
MPFKKISLSKNKIKIKIIYHAQNNKYLKTFRICPKHGKAKDCRPCNPNRDL